MAVKSKRLRFEILKRDGYRCRYCGATAMSARLHVDHVIPESKGGTDDPANLVVACADCNGGKSNVSLDESRIEHVSAEDIAQNTEDIRGYLAACKEREAAREEVRSMAVDHWLRHVGPHVGDRIQRSLESGMLVVVEKNGMPAVLEAIEATAGKASRERLSVRDATKYFFGVLRKRRAAPVAPSAFEEFFRWLAEADVGDRGLLERWAVWLSACSELCLAFGIRRSRTGVHGDFMMHLCKFLYWEYGVSGVALVSSAISSGELAEEESDESLTAHVERLISEAQRHGFEIEAARDWCNDWLGEPCAPSVFFRTDRCPRYASPHNPVQRGSNA